MALTINTNVASVRSNRAIDATQRELAKAVQRISSGVKLNSAKDDPAGVATADRMTVQIRSLSVAIQNANDGISLAQTAEGALQEVTGILQRVQELSVQASNPANSVSARTSLQAEVVQLNSEISRIAGETEFNGKKLLSGGVINANFLVGTRPDQTIKLSIPAVAASNLGSFFTTSNNTGDLSIGSANLGTTAGEAPANRTQSQSVAIRGFNSGADAPEFFVDFEETAGSIAAKINAVEGRTSVLASAQTHLTLSDIFDLGAAGTQTVSFRLYGLNEKVSGSNSNSVPITANITGTKEEGLLPLATAINNQESRTGVAATFGGANTILLSNKEGKNISLEAFARNAAPGGAPPNTLLRATGAAGTAEVILEGGTEQDSVTVGGTVALNSARPFSVVSGLAAFEGSLFANEVANEPQASAFAALENISVLNVDGAEEAIRVAANALEQVTGLRSDLGAIQNRFESTIATLESVRENTQTSRSRLVDTDFAEEVSRFTRAQILQQAGIAILAQANAAPFAVLELLRG